VQIQQVLVNLMRNAIEAMAACPVRDLKVATGLRPDGLIEVTVEDTGPASPTRSGAALHGVQVDKGRRHGPRPFDLPDHHRSAWGPYLDERPTAAARAFILP
jgi:hypothetical protein